MVENRAVSQNARIQDYKKGAPNMTSKEWREWQERSRPGEWAGPIIADLEAAERERDELRNSLQDAYDEMRGHGWYCETAMAEALAKYSASNIDRNVIADMTIYLPGPHAVNADCVRDAFGPGERRRR
jgi:nicotinamidase-related amidase